MAKKNPKHGTEAWEKLAGEVARSFAPSIYPCAHCDYPVVRGYCCGSCGSSNPYREGEA